jgi:CHASE1-domain containing sensor protein
MASGTALPAGRQSLIRFLPALVAVCGMVLSLGAWWVVRSEVRRAEQTRFQRLTGAVVDAIRSRFSSAEHALRGGAVLARVDPHLTRSDWRIYTNDIGPIVRQGLVGLGYIERINRAQIPEVEARQRADGLVNFKVEDEVKHNELYVVVLIEPEALNSAALGVDVGRGVRRRGAADRAMNTGQVAMTDLFPVAHGQGEVPGFLMFMPVYRTGTEPGTEAERRRALQGWVYASLEAKTLMKGVLDEMPVGMDCGVFEGDGSRPPTMPSAISGSPCHSRFTGSAGLCS